MVGEKSQIQVSSMLIVLNNKKLYISLCRTGHPHSAVYLEYARFIRLLFLFLDFGYNMNIEKNLTVDS